MTFVLTSAMMTESLCTRSRELIIGSRHAKESAKYWLRFFPSSLCSVYPLALGALEPPSPGVPRSTSRIMGLLGIVHGVLIAWGCWSSSENVNDDCVGDTRPWSLFVTTKECPEGIGKSLTVGVRR